MEKRGGDEFICLDVVIATRQMLHVLEIIIGSLARSTHGFKVPNAIPKPNYYIVIQLSQICAKYISAQNTIFEELPNKSYTTIIKIIKHSL